MIEMENLNSTVEDESLRLVLLFCGIEVKDKLLYRGEPYTRIVGNPKQAHTRTDETRDSDSAIVVHY